MQGREIVAQITRTSAAGRRAKDDWPASIHPADRFLRFASRILGDFAFGTQFWRRIRGRRPTPRCSSTKGRSDRATKLILSRGGAGLGRRGGQAAFGFQFFRGSLAVSSSRRQPRPLDSASLASSILRSVNAGHNYRTLRGGVHQEPIAALKQCWSERSFYLLHRVGTRGQRGRGETGSEADRRGGRCCRRWQARQLAMRYSTAAILRRFCPRCSESHSACPRAIRRGLETIGRGVNCNKQFIAGRDRTGPVLGKSLALQWPRQDFLGGCRISTATGRGPGAIAAMLKNWSGPSQSRMLSQPYWRVLSAINEQ